MRGGYYMKESYKATLPADLLSTQYVPPAYLMAEKLLFVMKFTADAEGQLEPIHNRNRDERHLNPKVSPL
jgi:hypothetical protein